MIVPQGKKVVILKNSMSLQGLEEINLTLDEDIQLSLSSTFDKIIGSKGSELLGLVAGVTRDFGNVSVSGQFKQFSLQVWKGTEPIKFSFTCTLNMVTNALNDVIDPAKALMKLPLPTDVSESTEVTGFGLIPPGPSILSAFGKTQAKAGNLYSIKVGKMYLHPVIITKVEPIFARDVDSSGYPIWCTLKMDCTTIYTATTGAIDKLF